MALARRTLIAFSLLLAGTSGAFAEMDPRTEAELKTALASPTRDAGNKARDQYRHPLEELKFFGLRDDMTVLEVWPGGGWWTEFLAPVVGGKGRYVLAGSGTAEDKDLTDILKDARAKNPALKVDFAKFAAGKLDNVAPNSLDLAMTFRNIHNWMNDDNAKQMFAAMYTALKPGGYLGVEEHRGLATKPQDPKGASGYVREDYAIDLIQSAGFKLVAKSEINANPKDTKDYPKGVWTLPPTYTEGDKDHAKYAAIGESDRFTLLFRKPAQ